MIDAVSIGLDRVPRVSIALPVYNGERYVAEAIASILSQTYRDLELIICDNASTDRTGEICRDFAAQDRRIRYFRNPENLGCAPNFNLAYSLAKGEFFKWQSHDDRLLPTFVEKCVTALDADTDAIMCCTLVGLINAEGVLTGVYDSGTDAMSSESVARRFAAIVLPIHMCTDFYGLARRAAMEGAPLLGSYHGSDNVHLADMALRGKLIKIKEPLFQNRSRPDRYSEGVRSGERSSWFATDRKTPRIAQWTQYLEFLRCVRRDVPSQTDRLNCYTYLAGWWFVHWNSVRMLLDIVGIRFAWAPAMAISVKQRLFGLRKMGIDWKAWRDSTAKMAAGRGEGSFR